MTLSGTRPRFLGDSGPGTWLTPWVHVCWVATFFAVALCPADPEEAVVLVELGLVEQRYQAVLEVLNDGATVTDVARRYGVARQTVHRVAAQVRGARVWAGWRIESSRPLSCPHQMDPVVEARIVEMRRAHPGWGPRTICSGSGVRVFGPLPGRTSVERCLVRHGLVTPQARKRKRSDYKRWERSRSMELWQMDIVGGVRSPTASEAKIVSGIDDHSRFVVSARVVARATARAGVRRAGAAMRTHGVPEQILTDNGKVFTARFGPGPGPVLFDRICADNGITHILTAPRSPTTTGKVERWHKTLRREFFDGKVFDSIEDAQAAARRVGAHYNHERPHQSLGDGRRSNGSSSPSRGEKPATPRRADRERRRR